MAVSFKSATDRRVWQSTGLVALLHIGVAIAVGHLIAEREPWVASALVYGAFLAVSFVWWASRQAVGWAVWQVIWRRSAINDLVADFQKAALPRPRSFLNSAGNYFEDIVNDEEHLFSVRMAAAAHYLRVVEFAPQQGIISSVRVTSIYEHAISAYRGAAA